ncbi:MAG: DUF4255 domain-containing protein [Reichenbachiella sp.]|uniref:DUF4255 domain-containing protein n=1 Tax=Reichenbachiella sp. TaxID=2184521 RepID=UPI003264ACF0
MILFQTFDFLRSQLNSHFRTTQRWGEDKAVLSAVNNDDSSAAADASDKLVLSLAQLAQEATLKNHVPKINGKNSEFGRANSPLSFNIDLLVSARCSKYEESLKLISDAVLYFQANNYFDHSTHPSLAAEVQKISLSIIDLPYQDLSHMWGMLGGKYVPSIFYRVRTVIFDSSQVKAYVPRVSSHESNNS